MALWNNKQDFESLQTENEQLQEKLSSLEIRLSVKEKGLAEKQKRIAELEQQVGDLETSLEKHKPTTSPNLFSHEIESLRQQHSLEIAKLEQKITALQIRPHNERGAGRKQKATPEQRDFILSLFSQGVSQVKIAKILAEQSGEKWNKSTVRNIILSVKS